MENKYIAVITGNKKQYDYFIQTTISNGIFKYVKNIKDILGIRYIGIIKFGTYEDVENYYDLIDEIIKRNNLSIKENKK